MAPWQQARVFGLKEAWEEMHGDKGESPVDRGARLCAGPAEEPPDGRSGRATPAQDDRRRGLVPRQGLRLIRRAARADPRMRNRVPARKII